MQKFYFVTGGLSIIAATAIIIYFIIFKTQF
jgi:hypothetical protein